jgi:uncharacterized protein (TIGR01777 family)
MSDQRIVVSGGSGLIGSALIRSLRRDGIRVVRLVRRPARNADEIEWLTSDAPLDPRAFRGARAIVNLNGASIGRLPWTRTYRETLADSRLRPTRKLAEVVRVLGSEAPQFVSASAVGFYGDRPGELLTEESTAGETFLAHLTAAWERAGLTAGPDARVALLRTAPLLHPRGVLKPLITLTRWGVSGPLGGGRQVWPWISLDDEVRAIRHVVDHGIAGPVNLSGPQPATAGEIGRGLARRMHRPYLLPAPGWALRLALGRDVADSLLLPDATVIPEVLLATAFEFRHPTAEAAIDAALTGE